MPIKQGRVENIPMRKPLAKQEEEEEEMVEEDEEEEEEEEALEGSCEV